MYNKIEPGSSKMWSRDMMQYKNPSYGKKQPTRSSIRVKFGHPTLCNMRQISHFLKIAHAVTPDISPVWPWKKVLKMVKRTFHKRRMTSRWWSQCDVTVTVPRHHSAIRDTRYKYHFQNSVLWKIFNALMPPYASAIRQTEQCMTTFKITCIFNTPI